MADSNQPSHGRRNRFIIGIVLAVACSVYLIPKICNRYRYHDYDASFAYAVTILGFFFAIGGLIINGKDLQSLRDTFWWLVVSLVGLDIYAVWLIFVSSGSNFSNILIIAGIINAVLLVLLWIKNKKISSMAEKDQKD